MIGQVFSLTMTVVRATVREQVGSYLENRSRVCGGSRKRVLKRVPGSPFSFLSTQILTWEMERQAQIGSSCGHSSHLGAPAGLEKWEIASSLFSVHHLSENSVQT